MSDSDSYLNSETRAKNLFSAEATAEARSPGPLPDQIFRLQPEPARRLNQHAQLLTEERALASRAADSRAFGADPAVRSSVRDGGVFSGFGVSSSFRVELDFPAFFVLPETSLAFFFADFGLGVGVWRRFDFGLRSGVSRGVGSGVASSSSSDFGFALRASGDSCASRDSLSSLVDSSFAALSFANFAWGIAVGTFSGSQKPCVFFPICPSMLSLPGSETFLVSETAKNAPRSVRTHPA